MKSVIITIDTEGDNLWKVKNDFKSIRQITNRNGEYIERFQLLCEKYKFIPTYLTNYEMAQSESFREMACNRMSDNKLEIGMHMHAFNCPPEYDLGDYLGGKKAFLGEYPKNIMFQKVDYLTKLLQDTFQTCITSHRGGRWYLDETYLRILQKCGYKVDCTVTPRIDWRYNKGQTKLSHGIDFRGFPNYPYRLSAKNIKQTGKSLWEVPVTIIDKPFIFDKTMLSNINKIWKPDKLWLRPDGNNLNEMLYLLKIKEKDTNNDYIEFMLHSSELMPGGSPIFTTQYKIEKLYKDLECLFQKIAQSYVGVGLSQYAKILTENERQTKKK